MKYKFNHVARQFWMYSFMLVITGIIIVPLVWMVSSSLKSIGDFMLHPWSFPRVIHLDNYIKMFSVVKIHKYFANSFIVLSGALIVEITISSMIAYAFARWKFRFRELLFYYVLIGLIIPSQAYVLPVFLIAERLHLLSTYTILILYYAGSSLPLSTFILHGFFKEIPQEIIDSAKVDGCSEWKTFQKIILPLSRPALAAVAIFIGLYIWNEFLYVLVLLRSGEKTTVTLGVYKLMGQYITNYPAVFAGLTLAAIPMIIIYVFFQKQFIKALTAGALKG